MKDYTINFWNSGYFKQKDKDIIGCSVHGFATEQKWIDASENQNVLWSNPFEGEVLSGNYGFVLKSLSQLAFHPVICILLSNNGFGIEMFIEQYLQILPETPLIGGGASIMQGQLFGELAPSAEDLVLLAVGSGKYEIQTCNIYDDAGITVEIKKQTPRILESIREISNNKWLNAIDFITDYQIKNGLDKNNFELLIFSDLENRNIHCRIEDGVLACGSDLPTDNILKLKIITPKMAEKRLSDFVAQDNSLTFGCAGIRSILKNPVFTGKNSLLVFMFGELVTLNQRPMFGNLMLTKLTLKN